MHEYAAMMIIGFALGLAAGFVMHRADFCMAAAFRDLFLFRSTPLLSSLLVLITVSAILFEAARLAGMLVVYPFPLMGPPSLGNLAGGFVFGVGMVMAGGCVVGLLYKVGSGCLLCWWGIVGMILGSALFAEIFPLWSSFARATVLSQSVTLPQLTGVAPVAWIAPLVVASVLFIGKRLEIFAVPATLKGVPGYLPPGRAAVLFAVIGLFAALTFGMPLGVTTSYAKWSAVVESFLWEDHYARLEFFRLTPLKGLVLPLAGAPLQGGPGAAFDGMAVIQYPLILGMIAGSAVSTLSLGEWRLIGGAPWRQRLSVLIGGVLLGLGSRMASGCNIWHLWGGVPIFSLASLIFLVGLFPGAWVGGLVLVKWIVPDKR